ncbi:MAG: glycosyltransferase [Ignavibacteria bacterium]|jgi:cellulose synthase/poly-beta-1,6-N-acetylglucosamine synthase-like glycosyltransferase/spore germination protein YaaH/peptidoglycan/xylan/chitin deacetylase (PgdA/CDA1 family)|nr:glycosyltransferase [Ignavibacteria bacterium]MCU7502661.1 glycosyltransferase [Ignavibacteria bacterium]MCU7515136.1 glycosyltransferase [Ignavibacteria bacterium]
MTNQNKPVFSSESDKRWRAFKGTIRFIIVLVLLAGIALGVDIISESGASLPRLREQNELYRKVLNPEHITTIPTKENRLYHKSRKELMRLVSAGHNKNHRQSLVKTDQIRAGFYVNWDAQSFYSLRDNIDKMNMVMPEWLFVPDNADTVVSDIDYRALSLMESHKVKIIPMVSNYFNEKWNPGNVERIISSRERRTKFIQSLVSILSRYRFQGVNIDFENLELKDKPNMLEFQKELFYELSRRSLIVTQDVPVGDEAYDYAQLQNYNNYLIPMAYDLHYSASNPGPIADIKWVEYNLYKIVKETSPGKIILGIPAYGYDWPQGDEGEDITYQEALVRAKESEGKIDFDNNNYNLDYTYYDDNDEPHTVWFTDAATCYNLIRTAEDFGTAGVALWRLGGEDPRLWTFYDKSLKLDSLNRKPLDTGKLQTIDHTTSLDFEGEGEILDIVSTPQKGIINIEYDKADQVISEENYEQLPSSFLIRKFGKSEKKVIVLTFDDGPDRRYTPAILDILKREHVPAAFFVLGVNAENNLSLIKRMYDEGHEIGNHSFMHPNLAITSLERTRFELNSTRRLIESITGHSTVLFRPPYDADTEPEHIQEILPIIEARNENYYTVGASIDPLDWQEGVLADSIMARIKREESFGSIILLHDAGGDRSQTVKELPEIIKYFKDRGYTFVSVASLLGKTRDDVMPALKNTKDVFLSKVNWSIAEVIYWITRSIFALFFLGIILALGRLILVGIFAAMQKNKRHSEKAVLKKDLPEVSLIVPAYNEAVHAVKNVKNLLRCNYPCFEIVFVDDGSRDDTYKVVSEAFKEDSKVRVFTKPNGGKATALNYGLAQARGEVVVCIDADTQLLPDAVSELVKTILEDENIAAVAGNVKVGNERNFLTKWQSIEYITSQNFDRRAFDLLNAITVVPGAIGAFRKKDILEAEGFTSDTLAEDCDITIRLLRNGHIIRYNEHALAYTEAPETVRMFLRQRFRWSFGIMQSLWKHRDAIFNHKYKNLGLIALPNILLFHFILPLFSPLAELMMVLGILGGYWQQMLGYYALFLILDFVSAAVAFMFEKEKLKRLWLILPQRFLYRQLMYWVLIKSFIAAIKGTLVGWGILKRTGKVQLDLSSSGRKA